mmetsp:Transcript_92283/g.260737  ORF Transcript_92283/g.260737 Transcript_92283/m.260737 type:complete len:297 (+) Transcript_92283:301-1191(+)
MVWPMAAILRPCCAARVTSASISPARSATMTPPTILSVPFRQSTLTNPRASPSRMHRSLWLRLAAYTSTSTPSRSACARFAMPHDATSGSVNVHRGTTKSESFVDGASTGGPRPSKRALVTQMLAKAPAVCVKRNAGLSTQSPAAKILGFVVEQSSPTTMPCLVYLTPASSRPKPSTFGARPAATSSASHRTSTASAPSGWHDRRISGQGAPALCDTCLMLAPAMTRTPSSSRTSRITLAASGSSGPKMRGAASSTVTSEPKRLKACAISRPMGPPPMTARRGGSSVRLKSVLLVK